MWLFNKKHPVAEILDNLTDYHSHILPGVDDGITSMDESLRVLSLYEKAGIREVWLTPHIMEDVPNTTDSLRKGFERLSNAYQGSIILHLASENMLDNLFETRLEKRDLLPLGRDGRHLLVETSYFNPPMALNNTLLRIKAKGYIPVLAHPERYLYMGKENYERLKALGVKFQLNLPSLVNAYGTEAQRNARFLLKKGMYDFTGLDTHSGNSLELFLQRKLAYTEIQMTKNIHTGK